MPNQYRTYTSPYDKRDKGKVEVIKQAQENDFCIERFQRSVVSPLLLLIYLLLLIGCGPLGITDPQSETPANSKPKKTWPVERTLISNEVNCIAADSDNVWVATEKGVSRWKRLQNTWHHYTMENGLAKVLTKD